MTLSFSHCKLSQYTAWKQDIDVTSGVLTTVLRVVRKSPIFVEYLVTSQTGTIMPTVNNRTHLLKKSKK